MLDYCLSIGSLHEAYRSGALTPQRVIADCFAAIQRDLSNNAWISVSTEEQLEIYLKKLPEPDFKQYPLWGIPFAIKDNIDLSTLPTTAACPSFSYQPQQDAFVVALLIKAGAIPLGKTNMDQFATGLVGTRSPYGAVPCVFDSNYISGGSSSGSAYAVAQGQVTFALGTDTAGSGRVPAAFNNLIGVKPSRGLVSNTGLVPACRSLDCITFFALNMQDASQLLEVCGQYDEKDPYARQMDLIGLATPKSRMGIPKKEQLYFLNEEYAQLFEAACKRMQASGAELIEIDFQPFLDAAKLLYEGPWVAERYHAVGEFLASQPGGSDPTVATIVSTGNSQNAVQAFDGFYRLQSLKRQADQVMESLDAILTPTVPGQFSMEEIAKDPIVNNSLLGYYTNFMNLLDYSALALPAGFLQQGLAYGVTLFAPAFHDVKIQAIGSLYLQQQNWGMGNTGFPMPTLAEENDSRGYIPVAVCGAHLSGMALNWQLQDRNSKLLEQTTTSKHYQFFALEGGPPFRPGLKRVEKGGEAIEVEIWQVPAQAFGSFVAGIPAPLGIGKLELADGRWVPGFICEPYGFEGAKDITELKSWRTYQS